MTRNHQERKHAKYSTSSTERLVNCPVNVFLSQDFQEDEETEKSREGSFAHEVGEMYLEDLLEGRKLRKITDKKYDKEMKRHGEKYAERCYNLVKDYLKYDHIWFIEKPLVIDLKKDVWGTCDFVFIYKLPNGEKHVIIVDYKYGKKYVKSGGNWQLIGYGYGAVKSFTGKSSIKSITTLIDQPRIHESDDDEDEDEYEPEPVTYIVKDLEEKYFPQIDKAVNLSEGWFKNGAIPESDLEQYQIPGDWCHFCKAKGICKAYKTKNIGPIIKLFKKAAKQLTTKEVADKESFVKSGILSKEELAFIAINKSTITNFIEAAAGATKALAMRGERFEGIKLITTNPKRFYDPNTDWVEAELKKLGIQEPIQVKESLISMSEVEKILGRGAIDHILRTGTEKSYKLVATDHKTPAAKVGLNTAVLFKESAAKLKRQQ